MTAAMNLSPGMAELQHDEPMSRHTSWRVGGSADLFFKPESVESLQDFLHVLSVETPLHWVGLGSNLLVRDGGVRGAVICTLKLPKRIDRIDPTRVQVGAGTPCAVFARQCVRWKLGPAAFFAGIPGTIGGALAMNSGAFGGETWGHVESVDTIDRSGERRSRAAEEFEVSYRSVNGAPQEWFLSATFALIADETADMGDVKDLLRKRGETQPLGKLSCGSVFRNPPGQFAAQLIEQAGLKGATSGDAIVSDKHANFIINRDSATAADIESLIELVRDCVAESSGTTLEPEVRIIGEPVERSVGPVLGDDAQ
ncbi:MAG TPA: UDP-N-acetylmuramate dehydrogenase [Planctomycetes bacterium]|nr:UDP-N-acetylmuramate dehydrogenase [Planctomycetota bacterium]